MRADSLSGVLAAGVASVSSESLPGFAYLFFWLAPEQGIHLSWGQEYSNEGQVVGRKG